MIGYCETCKSNDRLLVSSQGMAVIGLFEQVITKVICLNCGSEMLFTYDLSRVDTTITGQKNLKERMVKV